MKHKKIVRIFLILVILLGSIKGYPENYSDIYKTGDEYSISKDELEAYENAVKESSIESYELFLLQYPDSKLAEYISLMIEKAEYDIARKENTIESYDEFLGKYPKSRYRFSALYNRARLIESVEVYEEIMEEYPTVRRVIYYRDRAALNRAKEINTPEAFEEFIEKYPDSDWKEQAKYFLKSSYDPD